MSDRIGKYIAVLVLSLAASQYEMHSQEQHSIGTLWSLSGIGVDYRHHMDDDTFIWAQAKLEMTEIFLGKSFIPGAGASFTWNSVFAERDSANGCSIQFYAGPGVAAGYCRDYRSEYGPFFGLKGRVGARISYERRIDICIGIAPVIGMHIIPDAGAVSMKCYRYGLMQTILPEISISFRF